MAVSIVGIGMLFYVQCITVFQVKKLYCCVYLVMLAISFLLVCCFTYSSNQNTEQIPGVAS
jgi:hypothetical protein